MSVSEHNQMVVNVFYIDFEHGEDYVPGLPIAAGVDGEKNDICTKICGLLTMFLFMDFRR